MNGMICSVDFQPETTFADQKHVCIHVCGPLFLASISVDDLV